MNAVFQKCKPIIQNSSTFKSKLHRVKNIINAWKNGKILEIYIRNLRDRASKCYIQFMVRRTASRNIIPDGDNEDVCSDAY